MSWAEHVLTHLSAQDHSLEIYGMCQVCQRQL